MIVIKKQDFEFKNIYFFFSFILLYSLTSFYVNHFILTRDIYFNTLSAQMAYSKIETMMSTRQHWLWMTYVMLPLLLFIKVSYTSICLSIGCFMSGDKILFKDSFRIAIVAEICLALGVIIRIIWLTFTQINTLTDIQNFSPFSLAQLLGPRNIPKYLLYLCQTINLFEMAYWLVLAAGLVAFLEKPFYKMFKLVMSSYGVGLLLWIVFVSYLTVTFSA